MPAQLTRGFLEKVVRGSGWSLSEVESLRLEGESIASLGGSFGGVSRLVFLSLARNNLTSLKGIEHLSALATAILRANRLSSMREIDRLAELVNLRNLDLRLNPIMNASPQQPDSAYGGRIDQRHGPRAAVLQALPRLLNLDGREVYEKPLPRSVAAAAAAAREGHDGSSDGVGRASIVIGRSESTSRPQSSPRNGEGDVHSERRGLTQENSIGIRTDVNTATPSRGGERRQGAERPGPPERRRPRPRADVFLRSEEGPCAEVFVMSTGALGERGNGISTEGRAAGGSDGMFEAQMKSFLTATDRLGGGPRRRDPAGAEVSRSYRRDDSATAVGTENSDGADLSTSAVGGSVGAERTLNARGTTGRHHDEERAPGERSASDGDNIAALWLELGAGSLQLPRPAGTAVATGASCSHVDAETRHRKYSGCSMLAPVGHEDSRLFVADVAEEASSFASSSGARGRAGPTPRIFPDAVSRECWGRRARASREVEEGRNTGESRQKARESGRDAGSVGRCTYDDVARDDRRTADRKDGLARRAGAGKLSRKSSSGNDAFGHSMGSGLSVGNLVDGREVDALVRDNESSSSAGKEGIANASAGDQQEPCFRYRHSTATDAVILAGVDDALLSPPIGDAAVAASVTGDGPRDFQAALSRSSAAARAVEAFRQSSQRLGLLENDSSRPPSDAASGSSFSNDTVMAIGSGVGGTGKGTGVQDSSCSRLTYGCSGSAMGEVEQAQPPRGPPVAVTPKGNAIQEKGGGGGGEITSTFVDGGESPPVVAAEEAFLPVGAESYQAPASTPITAGLDTTTTTVFVAQRGVVSETASRQSFGRPKRKEEDCMGRGGVKERILAGGHGPERIPVGGRELRERWKARETEFASKWAEREAEFDARWAAREREYCERRHDEAKGFTEGMWSMLMEAHEALMASNAWLVARLKAVESTNSSVPMGSETNVNCGDSGVPPSTVGNQVSDFCRSCSKALTAKTRTPSPSRRIALPHTATAVLPGREGSPTEDPRLRKNDVLKLPVEASVPREGYGVHLGGRVAGGGTTFAPEAEEGWARQGAGSGGGKVLEVRQTVRVGVVVPFAEGIVERDSHVAGGGCPVEEVPGSTLGADAFAASSGSGHAVGGGGVGNVAADGCCVAPTSAGLPSAEAAEAPSSVGSTALVVAQGVTDAFKAPAITPSSADGTRPMSAGKEEMHGQSLLPRGKLGLDEGGEGRHRGDGGSGGMASVLPLPPAVPSVPGESCRVRGGGGGVACHEPEVTVSASIES